MNTEKNTCIFFKTLFDAAEKIKETNPGDALEIYSAFFKYAFGYTEKIETSSMIAELVVMQNIPSFEAAANRYNAAVENGKKGKEFGILGKEYGKLGGRPRKGETKEQANERRENETKTGKKEPYTPPVDEKRERAKNLAKGYKKADKNYDRGESTLTAGWIKKNIFSGQKCVYCGETDWHLLGCDRIDNSLPHTPENVVCSCSKCNVERGSMTFEEFREKKCLPPKTPLTVSVSDAVSISDSLSISKSISDKNKELNNLSIDIPTIELKEGNTSPGTPNACQPVKSRLDNFDLASANKLPDMERRLEHQYYYVLKDLPALEKNHYSFTEACYLKETLDWVEATEDFPVLTNCMLMWYDGGRAKLAEMVQGLAPNVTKDILTYLVLSGKYYDAQTSMNNYQPVYSV